MTLLLASTEIVIRLKVMNPTCNDRFGKYYYICILMKSFRFEYKSFNNITNDRDSRIHILERAVSISIRFFWVKVTLKQEMTGIFYLTTYTVWIKDDILRINAGLRNYTQFLSVYDIPSKYDSISNN